MAPNTRVIRTSAVSTRIARRFGFGCIGLRSLWHHWRVLSDLCRKEEVDVILISVPPYFSMILGRLAFLRYGIPYVIDYQDPWVTELYWQLPRAQRPPKWAFAYTLSRILEPFSLRRAAGIVGVSKRTIDSVVARYKWADKVPQVEIPFGFEQSDFEYLAEHPRRQKIFDPHDGLVHLSYIGACIPPMYPAVRAVFTAFRSGLEESPEYFRRLRLHFVGSSYAAHGNSEKHVLHLASEFGLSEYVDEHPNRVTHLDSLQLLRDSHALLMVGSMEPHYTASKVFSYILAERPILAVFHRESTVVNILQDTNLGRVVTFDGEVGPAARTEEIQSWMKQLLEGQYAHQSSVIPCDMEQYSARSMTSRLASLLTLIQTRRTSIRAM